MYITDQDWENYIGGMDDSGSIDMLELDIDETDAPQSICITAERSEHEMINQALKDFVAALCEELRKELYGVLYEAI